MSSRVRILIAAVGTRGDVQPMLALALALRARGHQVRFCAPPNFAGWIEGHAFPFRALGQDFQALLARIGPAVHRGVIAVRRDVRAQFAAMADLVRDADVILGASVHCAGLSHAQALGIPYGYVCYTPSLLPSARHPSPTWPWLGLPAWLNRLSWWLNDRLWNLLFRGPLNHERRRLGLPPIENAFRHLLSAPLLLASEPALGRPPADAPFPVVQTGAWFLPDPGALPPALEAFLSSGTPPVYVGFGSMADRRAARTTTRVIEAARAAGLRLVIGSGWAALGQAIGSGDDRIHVAGDVPHAALFPRVCAVVHHGGAGTTATAARAGVPQVLVPHFLDQFYWADRIGRLGLGPPPIPRHRLTASRLARALRACVEAPDLAARARAFAAGLVADGLDRGVRAVEALAMGRAASAGGDLVPAQLSNG